MRRPIDDQRSGAGRGDGGDDQIKTLRRRGELASYRKANGPNSRASAEMEDFGTAPRRNLAPIVDARGDAPVQLCPSDGLKS